MNQMITFLKNKIFQVFLCYSLIFIPMWTVYLMNNVFFNGSWNSSVGIQPRTFEISQIFSMTFSWLFHADYQHIFNNSMILIGLVWMVAILEKNPFIKFFFLAFVSGFFTWLLGAPNSYHIGASGVVFSLFGYILGSAIIGKQFRYIPLLIFFGGSYYYSITQGLIPQEGVSFAAHFGGLMAGILLGYMNQHFEEQNPLQKKIKIK